jgi:hypothetical protein
MGIARPRSILTESVSDLLLPVGSRSYGRNKEGKELTGKGSTAKSLVAMEINGEVSPVVLCVNRACDGLQRVTVRSRTRRHLREGPATPMRGGWRLGRGHVMQSMELCDEQGRIWETGLLPEIREDEAKPVVRFDESRCMEPSAIAHRGFIWQTVRSGRGCCRRSGA